MTQMLHLKIMQHFLHVRQINEIFIDEVNHLYIAILMYSLIEYSDNCSDTSGCLFQFKRDGFPADNTDLTIDNS